MRIRTILISLTAVLLLSSCSHFDFSRRVVQQGNLLPQTLVNRIKVGMSKTDVANILGTSLLSPTFNDDRWDYAYTWRKANGPLLIRNVSLYFHNGAVVRIERKP